MTKPPGQVGAAITPEIVMMICTAGHVDHGKTSLVKLLTGCETDRLKTEQERGLTIELGFAPCLLKGNLCVGIVDVPGHDKFIKNMVAGVSGIGMTVLVIAADDGVMPQTVEHFQIMDLLGVRHGMVALTKTDLASEEEIALRVEEIGEFLRGTFMEDAPICPVSSKTFEGFPEFYDTLVDRIGALARPRRLGVFRMPIERVFAQKGFGAVLSGIPVEGTIEIGAQVEVVPGGQRGRIRGIERFARAATEGRYGQCLALNIPDLGKAAPTRGQVVSLPGYLRPAKVFHLAVSAVSGIEKPLSNAEEIKFHTGTSSESGKIHLLEEKVLAGGPTSLATVILSNPVAAAACDRFIIRRSSPAITVAGGEILSVTYDDRRPRKKVLLERLRTRLDFFEGVDPASEEGVAKRVERFLLSEQKTGASLKDVSRGTLLTPEAVKECIANLIEGRRVAALLPDYFVHADAYRACLGEAERRVQTIIDEEKALSLPLADLRKRFDWPTPLWKRIQRSLEKKSVITLRGAIVFFDAAVGNLSPADQQMMARLLETYEQTGYHSPRPEELPERLNATTRDIERLKKLLLDQGRLVQVSKQVILSYAHFRKAQDMVVESIRENGALNSADFKNNISSSRKYALAILDYLDSRGITLRADNDRRLAPGYEDRLL